MNNPIKIPLAKKDSVHLIVKRVDDKAVFKLNGSNVYEKTNRNDTPIDELPFGLGFLLEAGDNKFGVELYNMENPGAPNENPWALDFTVVCDGLGIIHRSPNAPTSQPGRVYSEDWVITVLPSSSAARKVSAPARRK
jgi:hypothetical protein